MNKSESLDFIKQYIKILSYMCTGIVFAFASFYILANAYHYLELRKDFVTRYDEQNSVVNVGINAEKARTIANQFDPNNYTGNIPATTMNAIKQNILTCVAEFNNETSTKMLSTDRITILDVYYLREAYENNVVNNCVGKNLYWVTEIEDDYPSAKLVANKKVNKVYLDSLYDRTIYLKKDLLNNSSYFYNTTIASISTKDYTRDAFYEVMDAYENASEYLLTFAEWFKEEAGLQ